MKDAFVTIHGHFYQPPRENPWLEAIETEESAHPFHDWNERIAFECYRPNAYARVVDGRRRILDIHNNYSSISFNFGPTLLSWLEEKSPLIYQKVIEADREGLKRFGHGNAMAQVYNHIIMPLANERDKETEVLWGIADLEKRFHRKPDAMWLPETAVNYATLRVLVKYGMKYLILSPFQALRARPFGGKKWADVSQGRIDPTQPYRCFIRDASGKKRTDQFIDIFFYDGTISREVSFGDLLRDGNVFCEQFARAYQPSKKGPQLIHIATDGETYGHHKKFGDMALAYALKEGLPSREFEIINYGAFLKRVPPVYEVEIDEGPKGEGTSWSCMHGVGRWKEDCGCSTGGKEGWNQKWRKPLREALDFLRDELASLYEKEGEKIFRDVWEARNGYIEVILDRSPQGIRRFLETFATKTLDEKGRIKGLRLLEMERHALLMYTSCGWFFADLSGLETVQILKYASRAIQLAEELTGQGVEEKFVEYLSRAKSNLPEMGDGKQVYQTLVKPSSVTLEKVVNHFAVSSFFAGEEKERKIFSYRTEVLKYEKMKRDDRLLVLGQVRVTSEIISETKEFLFGLIPSTKDIFRTWVSEYDGGILFNTLREKGTETLEKGEEEMEKTLTSLLGNRIFTLRDVLKEEKQAIFQKLIEKDLKEYLKIYAELYDRSKQTVEALAREGFEIPYEIRVAAEVTLSDQLLKAVKDLRRDLKGALRKGDIDKIIDEAKRLGYHLRKEETILVLKDMLKESMGRLRGLKEGLDLGSQEEQIEALILLLDQAEKWGLEIPKEEVQDSMDEILKEYVLGLEESWWGEGREKPFSLKIISLAEKLGFNVEKFSKIVGSATSKTLQ
jgi:alpha-amylase/alpha-mannosidase (GH57 family)